MRRRAVAAVFLVLSAIAAAPPARADGATATSGASAQPATSAPANAADGADAGPPGGSPASATSSAAPLTPGQRALAVGAAIVPGAALHGAGSFVAGNKKTAAALAIAGGTGAAVGVGSLAAVALTGASRRVVAPLATTAVLGFGVFFTSFVADLYGVLAPQGGTGEPLRSAPRFETRLGVLGLHDPVFSHGYLVDQRVDARLGPVRLSAAAQFAPKTTSSRLRAETALRLTGPVVGSAPARDGSFVDLEAALTDHGQPTEGFGSTLGELSVRGRWDLARLSSPLTGSFVEGLAGTGILRDRYTHGESDVGSILLARFAWGLYLGRPSTRPNGEVSFFYDHRRDGWIAGLQPNGVGAGYLGSIGAAARVYLSGPWGLAADAQVGSAVLAGLSVLYRSEEP